uniref:Uncharacterized protein n=1 Tax=Aegilops tauschii subsp. strangulata TaxID=200361 RepID=A0A453QMT3_AEGTS
HARPFAAPAQGIRGPCREPAVRGAAYLYGDPGRDGSANGSASSLPSRRGRLASQTKRERGKNSSAPDSLSLARYPFSFLSPSRGVRWRGRGSSGDHTNPPTTLAPPSQRGATNLASPG